MDKPLVSAVIITYNQEKYIEQTIDCALAQRVDFPYEIVIGEDCSTDRTREICMSYQEKHPDIIRVITSDKNVGLLDNWCRSVKAGRGKYIAGCAGDDYWHNPDKMYKQVHFLEENPDYGMVHSDADYLYEEAGYIKKNILSSVSRNFSMTTTDAFELLLAGNYPIIAGTVIFRKILFEQHFKIEELKENGFKIEDTPLWCEIAAHSYMHYMPNSFLTHREMVGTVSNPQSIQDKIKFIQSGYKCQLFYCDKYSAKLKCKDDILANIHRGCNSAIFRMAFGTYDKKLARESYRNINRLTGKKRVCDKILYILTYIPFGMYFFRWYCFLKKE